ncbi:MAG: hypothetical protein JRN54_11465 [Nitrososphaerota archaeon]|jgi:hypothetical protein|nr:hypothetical protein [Nitrososphaerota archaeon]MDG6971698.1 hypothetical protein [Nitrososphaerota archaeon]
MTVPGLHIAEHRPDDGDYDCHCDGVADHRVFKDDPKDDMVVNTAIDGKSDYIVSGDRHLKKLRRFRGVRVVSPRAFMGIVARELGSVLLAESDVH